MDEYLDLVDENDQVIGKKKCSEIYAEHLNNFRVVNGFIANSEGKLWIPRRSGKVGYMALAFDFSVGGHVASSENYEDAFRREMHEEVKIKSDSEIKLLGHLTPKDGVACFMHVYEICMDGTLDYNRDDFAEYYWLTPTELLEKIAAGEKAKSDLPLVVKKFYAEL